MLLQVKSIHKQEIRLIKSIALVLLYPNLFVKKKLGVFARLEDIKKLILEKRFHQASLMVEFLLVDL